MIGLVNTAIGSFVRDLRGDAEWQAVLAAAGVRAPRFEPLLHYEDGLTDRLLQALADRMGAPRPALLEDLGIYLVSHPTMSALRRLLRFGGADFADFVHSLADLPARVRLALPDLPLPPLGVEELAPGCFRIRVGAGLPGLDHVLTGLLRAMADDYGALALVEPGDDGPGCILIGIAEADFSEGREFRLAPLPGTAA